MSRIYVDRYTGHLERSDLYLVRLTLKDGTVIENLEPKRLFPYSNPKMFITLLDTDEHEIGFIRDYEELDEASRNVLDACFADYYMIPKIRKLVASEEKFGSLKWTVETDRGRITFQIRNRHSDIKAIYGTRRVIIRDANDNRYEIENTEEMDPHSKYLLYPFL